MFYDLEDYASQYRETINPACVDPNIPKVDNSSVECDQVISSNCVVTPKGFPYLGIGSGETITSVIEKIKEKFKSISFTIQNLGSGIGILKGFSGGVLTAKTIAAGNNIQLTEANDTITINAIGGGSGGGVIDVTHAQLVTFKNNNQLVPGTFYRITDFRTMYDQPDFDANGVAKTSVAAKLGPIEPIIVLALTDNTLSSKAHQEAYPKDVIEYMLEFTTPVNNTVTKGRIIYRKDEWGNETDFDHRNVLFKRYLHVNSQKNISYKDTSLASVELSFLPSTPNASFLKSVGYFKNMYQQNSNIVFDLPNNIITHSVYNTTLGPNTINSTFYILTSSELVHVYNSIVDIRIQSSKINYIIDSELFLYAITAGYGINLCSIDYIENSICKFKMVSNSTIKALIDSHLGSISVINSYINGITNVGVPNPNGFPLISNSADIYNSQISDLSYLTGDFTIFNTYLYSVGNIDFQGISKITNVRGHRFVDLSLKNGQEINDLNILGDLESLNLSTSTIIYDTTLSKEIIKHPNGLYIKHYDQFGAAVINNVNA